jgi:hypothetical protein
MSQSASPLSTPTSGSMPPPAPSQPNGANAEEEGVIFNARRVTQALVLIASAICFWMFWTAGEWVNYPVEMGHSGSILYQGGGVLKLIAFWVVLAVATAVATALTSWRWYLAGLFSACLGSTAWAIRGGILRYVLFSASSPSVFLVLAVEQILLIGGVAGLWLALWYFGEQQAPTPAEQPTKTDFESPDVASPGAGDPVFAIATQTLAMGIMVLILAATDSAKQVNISVFIAAAVATAIAQSLQKAQGLGRWYWVGPMLVGLIGYIGCFITPRGWDVGQPIGTFAPLARPLPICYASFGMAGALLGYWATSSVLSFAVGSALAIGGFHRFKVRRRVPIQQPAE